MFNKTSFYPKEYPEQLIPISGVAVALQLQGDTSVIAGEFNNTYFTATGVVVTTDSSGYYDFTNVPSGNYRIVEAYGYIDDISRTGSWADASSISVMPRDPDYTHVQSVISASDIPDETNAIESLTPNTIYQRVVGSNTYSG